MARNQGTNCHPLRRGPSVDNQAEQRRRRMCWLMGTPEALPADERRGHVTTLLRNWTEGDDSAMEELAPLVYDELRRLARRQMSREREDHVLQATALVNEAFLRLVDIHKIQWRSRTHFFAIAARFMRRVLVEHARSRAFRKRGGGALHVTFDENLTAPQYSSNDLVALDDALKALAAVHERKAQVVELRHFGGLSVEETAGVLDVSPETVMRDWKYARSWLLRELSSKPRRHG
jgi:RNA polymerase sigma-70 factor (ECF subfamily)